MTDGLSLWHLRLYVLPMQSPSFPPLRDPVSAEDPVDEPVAVSGPEEEQPGFRGVGPHDCVRRGCVWECVRARAGIHRIDAIQCSFNSPTCALPRLSQDCL